MHTPFHQISHFAGGRSDYGCIAGQHLKKLLWETIAAEARISIGNDPDIQGTKELRHGRILEFSKIVNILVSGNFSVLIDRACKYKMDVRIYCFQFRVGLKYHIDTTTAGERPTITNKNLTFRQM